jgi:hypothetical protein
MVQVLRAYDARYARALRVAMAYAASLLEQPANAQVRASIDAALSKQQIETQSVTQEPQKTPATKAQKRARSSACDDAENDKALRSGAIYRDMCVVPKRAGARRAEVDKIIAESERKKAMAWDEDVFVLVHDIDEMTPGTRHALAAIVERTAKSSATPQQLRRLEVLQSRISAAGIAVGARIDASGALLAHVTKNAKAGKPHGLPVHELGCIHTELIIGTKVVARTMYTPGQLQPTWTGWFAKKAAGYAEAWLAPGAMGVAREVQKTVSRSAHYSGYEDPGVGYVLLTLLEILDYASLDANQGLARSVTLAAIGELLGPQIKFNKFNKA